MYKEAYEEFMKLAMEMSPQELEVFAEQMLGEMEKTAGVGRYIDDISGKNVAGAKRKMLKEEARRGVWIDRLKQNVAGIEPGERADVMRRRMTDPTEGVNINAARGEFGLQEAIAARKKAIGATAGIAGGLGAAGAGAAVYGNSKKKKTAASHLADALEKVALTKEEEEGLFSGQFENINNNPNKSNFDNFRRGGRVISQSSLDLLGERETAGLNIAHRGQGRSNQQLEGNDYYDDIFGEVRPGSTPEEVAARNQNMKDNYVGVLQKNNENMTKKVRAGLLIGSGLGAAVGGRQAGGIGALGGAVYGAGIGLIPAALIAAIQNKSPENEYFKNMTDADKDALYAHMKERARIVSDDVSKANNGVVATNHYREPAYANDSYGTPYGPRY